MVMHALPPTQLIHIILANDQAVLRKVKLKLCINITERIDYSCNFLLTLTHANYEGTGQQAEEISFVNREFGKGWCGLT